MNARLAILIVGCGLIGCATQEASARDAEPDHDDTSAIDDVAEPPATTLHVYLVKPKDADPGVTTALEPSYAMRDSAATPNGRLFLFFPGHGQLPSQYQRILKTAAAAGYLVLGLRYRNQWDVGQIIDGSSTCTKHGRMEIWDGLGESDLGVTPPDSALHRINHALSYLAQLHPADGWAEFLANGQPVWASIVAAGHSFGGGEASLVGFLHHVHRVVMFSSPDDHCSGSTAPPTWIGPGATPASARFGFGHEQDPVFATQVPAWTRLGMHAFGAVVDRDTSAPPYHASHELETDITPPTGISRAHQSTVEDADTPMAAGKPVFTATWQYLIGP